MIATDEEVIVLARVACPKCSRTLHKAITIKGFMIDQSNSDIVSSTRTTARSTVLASAARRGWTEARCGQCGDPNEKDADE